MPINTIAFKESLTAELDQKAIQAMQTGIFADNNLRGKFVGAKTVIIPTLGMSGLGDYDRDTGFARGGVSVSHKPFTLTMDRGTSFQIDAQDADESGIPDLAGHIMGEFVRTKVAPEVDAYVLSKLAGVANEKGHTVSGNIDTEMYKMLTKAIGQAKNEVGYDEELLAFVDSTALAALENSPEISRHLVVNDFKAGEIITKVKTLNGVTILPVQDSRMKTAYIFHDGVDADSFGFEPAESAKNIGFMVMPRRGASLVKKTEQVRTFTPQQNQKADAYQLDYRTCYDVVVKDSLADGIYAHIYG